jgi:menaquinone-dependent protoporphyrinogen IX oxidase
MQTWKYVLPGLALMFLPVTTPCLLAQASGSSKHVLVATESSRFKDAVVTQISQSLLAEGHQVTVIGLGRLAATPLRDYQAIVLVNTCRAWRPSSEVRDFLRRASDADKKRLVVVTTANSETCDLKVSGVDAISAASKRIRTDSVAQAVLDKVRARLAAP